MNSEVETIFDQLLAEKEQLGNIKFYKKYPHLAPLKRFLLFMGHTFYPDGGWNDFKGDFDTWTEAEEVQEIIFNKEGTSWWQLVDSYEGKIFAEGKTEGIY